MPLDAQAQAIRKTLEGFHLFGTWSPDCAEPPTRFNAWVAYLASADGTVTRQQILDENGTARSEPVVSARRVAADRLALSYKWGGGTADLLMEFRGDRHRSLEGAVRRYGQHQRRHHAGHGEGDGLDVALSLTPATPDSSEAAT